MKQSSLQRRRVKARSRSRSRRYSSRTRSRSKARTHYSRSRHRRTRSKKSRSRRSRRSYKGGAGKATTSPIDLTNDDDFVNFENRPNALPARTLRPSASQTRHHPYSRPAPVTVTNKPFPRIANRTDINAVPTVPPELREASLQVLREEEQKEQKSQPNLFVDLEALGINTMGGLPLQAETKGKMLAYYDLLRTRKVVAPADQSITWNWEEALEYATEPNESEMEEFAEKMYEGEDWVDTKINLVMVIRLAPNTPIMVEGEAAAHIVLPPGYRFQPYGVEFKAKLLQNPYAPEDMQPYVMYFDYVRC